MTVVVILDEIAENRARVQLHQLGWQAGQEWQAGWRCFDRAWEHVLVTTKHELERRFTTEDLQEKGDQASSSASGSEPSSRLLRMARAAA